MGNAIGVYFVIKITIYMKRIEISDRDHKKYTIFYFKFNCQ